MSALPPSSTVLNDQHAAGAGATTERAARDVESAFAAERSERALENVDLTLASELDALLDGEFASIDTILGPGDEPALGTATGQFAMPALAPALAPEVRSHDAEISGAAPDLGSPFEAEAILSDRLGPQGPHEPNDGSGAESNSQAGMRERSPVGDLAQPRATQPRTQSAAVQPDSAVDSITLRQRVGVLMGSLCGVSEMIGTWASLPMRVLPPRLRPVVTALALTLAVWAPIVWLAAPMMGERARHKQFAAADTHDTAPAPSASHVASATASAASDSQGGH